MRKLKGVVCILILSMCLPTKCDTVSAQGLAYVKSADVDGILGGSGDSTETTEDNGSDGQNAKEASEAFKRMGRDQINENTIQEADRVTNPAQLFVGYALSVSGIMYFLVQSVITVTDLFALLVPVLRAKLLGIDGGRQLCSDTAYGVLEEYGYVGGTQLDAKNTPDGKTQQPTQNQVQGSNKILKYLGRRAVFIISATVVVILVISNTLMKLGFFLVGELLEMLVF